MQLFNNLISYGLLAKLFHWVSFLVLIAQIPFGFYLVDLEFSEKRISLENIHIIIGISIFYLIIFRLIWKSINITPRFGKEIFKGQLLISKVNHFFLYIAILSITISGILKKLYMGEKLNFFIFKFGFEKTNFELSDNFYLIHIYANYILISLIALHIGAVIFHYVFFKNKHFLKKMLW